MVTLSCKERNSVFESRSFYLKFDLPAIKIAERFKNTRQVIIVSGAWHTLSIHHLRGWPVQLLIRETAELATHLLQGYYRSYILPQLIG